MLPLLGFRFKASVYCVSSVLAFLSAICVQFFNPFCIPCSSSCFMFYVTFLPCTRATHARDEYDFYKPKHSEYAEVDGRLSQVCAFWFLLVSSVPDGFQTVWVM